jgi:hypothetical protein
VRVAGSLPARSLLWIGRSFFDTVSLLPDRLMVGHRPLEASILVRIQVRQLDLTLLFLIALLLYDKDKILRSRHYHRQ